MGRAMTRVGHGPTRAATRRMPPHGEQMPGSTRRLVDTWFTGYLLRACARSAARSISRRRASSKLSCPHLDCAVTTLYEDHLCS
jgi:hypothetical protein